MINPLYLFLDLLPEFPVKVSLVLLLLALGLDLVIVEGSHFCSIAVHVSLSFRAFHVILYDVLERQHVPSSILPWLHLTRGSLLEHSLELSRGPPGQRASSPTLAVVLDLLVGDWRYDRVLKDLWCMLERA